MTKGEKTRRIKRLEKRLNRFLGWVEHYKSDNFVNSMQCSVKARSMAIEIMALAATPTDD